MNLLPKGLFCGAPKTLLLVGVPNPKAGELVVVVPKAGLLLNNELVAVDVEPKTFVLVPKPKLVFVLVPNKDLFSVG